MIIIKKNTLEYSILAIFTLLLIVYPIPHTIAMRYLLIFSLIILSVLLWRKEKIEYNFINSSVFIPFIFFILLILWSIFVALFSTYTVEALNQIKSQLIIPLIIGILMYIISSSNHYLFKPKNILTIIFIAIFIFILYSNTESLIYFLENGNILRRSPAGIGLDNLNFISAFLLAIVTVEIFYRIYNYKYYLPFNNFIFTAISVFIFFGFIVVQAKRLGVTSVVFLFISFLVLFFIENRHKANISIKKIFSIILVILILISSMVFYSVSKDKRWDSLLNTFEIAVNTEKHTAWKHENIPELLPLKDDGEAVDGSNYLRIAWISKSIQYIYENPLGYGFSKQAFQNISNNKYPGESIRTVQAHSGMMDLGLGSGVVGILIWIIIVAYIILTSIIRFYKNKNYFSLLTILICTGYSFRMLVDSSFRDQNLQMFVILIVFLLTSSDKKTLKAKVL
jgi:hypothetical protein